MQEDREADEPATILVGVNLWLEDLRPFYLGELPLPVSATLGDAIVAAWVREVNNTQSDMDEVRRWRFTVKKRCAQRYRGQTTHYISQRWALPYFSQPLTKLRALLDTDDLCLCINVGQTQDETLLVHLLAQQRHCDDTTYRGLRRLIEAQLWHGVPRLCQLRSPPVYKPRSETFHWSCMQFHWQRWGRQYMALRRAVLPDLPPDVQMLMAQWLAYLSA